MHKNQHFAQTVNIKFKQKYHVHGNQFLSIELLKMFHRNIDSILDILTNFTIIPNGDYDEVEAGFQRAYLPFGRG
jgi:hypothetical protein